MAEGFIIFCHSFNILIGTLVVKRRKLMETRTGDMVIAIPLQIFPTEWKNLSWMLGLCNEIPYP